MAQKSPIQIDFFGDQDGKYKKKQATVSQVWILRPFGVNFMLHIVVRVAKAGIFSKWKESGNCQSFQNLINVMVNPTYGHFYSLQAVERESDHCIK